MDAIEAGDFGSLDDVQDELEEASDNVGAFVNDECGFDIEEEDTESS